MSKLSHSEKVANYWVKREEKYSDGKEARTRAGNLRNDGHVTHVQVRGKVGEYVVTYSVPQWYLDELEAAGLRL